MRFILNFFLYPFTHCVIKRERAPRSDAAKRGFGCKKGRSLTALRETPKLGLPRTERSLEVPSSRPDFYVGKRISLSAESDSGLCPKAPQAFEKACAKLLTAVTGSFFSYSSSAFSGRRSVMLLRLMPSVDILCRSAEVVGWMIPPTPSRMSMRLKPTMKR